MSMSTDQLHGGHGNAHYGGDHGGHGAQEHSFWSHIIGFILSLILTYIALRLVLDGAMKPAALFTVIFILAIIQIAIQLYFFMHITERIGPRYHVLGLMLGAVFVIAIVAGSIWIMSFGGYQAY